MFLEEGESFRAADLHPGFGIGDFFAILCGKGIREGVAGDFGFVVVETFGLCRKEGGGGQDCREKEAKCPVKRKRRRMPIQ